MSKAKRAKKEVKESGETQHLPSFLYDPRIQYFHKQDMEKAYAHWVVENGVAFGSTAWKAVQLQDLVNSLKTLSEHWA